MSKKRSRSWLIILFGLPFAGVGLGVLILSIIPTLYDWSRMKAWIPADAVLLQASLESSRSDDSDTYRATASYQYYLGGSTYQSDRVAINTGSDNIGDFQEQLGRKLEWDFANGRSIQIWVNPEYPAEAVIDRSLRLSLLAFKLIFVLIFGVVGIGIILAGFLLPATTVDHPEAGSKPWVTRPDWAANKIYSSQKASMWFSWFFAGVWNLISLPLAVAIIPQELSRGNYKVAIALLFPLVGLGLLYWAIKVTRDWKRFGNVYLSLDPFPGAIGGHVGANIELPIAFNYQHRFKVVLNCLYQYQSGSGKNRETRYKSVWQAEGLAQSHASPSGTVLGFRFSVPSGLPISEPAGTEYHLWRVDIDNPEVGFSRSFDIPVFATGAQSKQLLKDADDHPQMQEIRENLIDEVSDLEQIPGGVRLYFPMLRSKSTSLSLALVGAAFAGSGAVAYNGDAPMFFPVVFGGLGGLLFLWGIYLLFNSLTVELDRQGLRTWRFWLGIPLGNKDVRVRMLSDW